MGLLLDTISQESTEPKEFTGVLLSTFFKNNQINEKKKQKQIRMTKILVFFMNQELSHLIRQRALEIEVLAKSKWEGVWNLRGTKAGVIPT